MSITMYQASAPVFVRMLTNLSDILKKGVAHAEARKFDPQVLFNARLAPDMFPLVRQVQIATDQVKGCMSRLAGLEPPKYEDNEKNFDDLFARIDKTIAHIKSFKPEQIDGTEDRKIELTVAGQPMTFQGQPYLLHRVYPNFFFHITAAYAILRHNGVEIGKKDFIGPAQ